MPTTDHLASWNDTAATEAIVGFVQRAADEGGPGFIAPEERIAVFDNDGTLWSEKPMPIQLAFTLERFVAMAEADPSLGERQPFKAAVEGDVAWLQEVMTRHYAGDDSLVKVLMGGILQAFAGMTVEDVIDTSARFVHGTPHPTLARPYAACAFLPMIELLRYLEAHGFTTFIASAGDRDFMRAIGDDVYGIPPERIIGSSNALAWSGDEDGGALTYLAQPDVFDDGPTKPVRIWSRTGRRPTFAAGNSNGDIPMLQWTRTDRPVLRLLVDHDDAEREFAYRTGAEDALAQAAREGWTVVSVKDDWNAVHV
jgi:phosphoserine phosphatase